MFIDKVLVNTFLLINNPNNMIVTEILKIEKLLIKIKDNRLILKIQVQK
jgi:hypothetical protein